MGWINLYDAAPPGFFDGVHDTDPCYMTPEEEAAMSDETYIGDGVYASFDGLMIKLRTRREEHGPDHVIYLEPEVYDELVRFAGRCFRGGKTEEQPKPTAPDEEIAF